MITYVDSVDKLAESSLPPKEVFYSRLNDESISDEDYEHAKTVWKEFGIKTLGECTSLYNKVDVVASATACCVSLRHIYFYHASSPSVASLYVIA